VIPLVLVGLAAMLSGILMSYITAHWERGDRDKVASQLRWTLKLMGAGFTLAALATLVVAPWLFDTVLQGRYADGLAVLPMTFVYCIWYSLLTVGQDWLWCREKGKWACLAVAIGLAVNFGLNAIMIPEWGLWGAVWATAISNAIALVALYAMNMRFGWRPDRGIWFAAGLPLVLLLPTHVAVMCCGVLCWGGVQYGWLFDGGERRELRQHCQLLLRRTQWVWRPGFRNPV
jgi:O-antigen/teichoic acid export membrane protein